MTQLEKVLHTAKWNLFLVMRRTSRALTWFSPVFDFVRRRT